MNSKDAKLADHVSLSKPTVLADNKGDHNIPQLTKQMNNLRIVVKNLEKERDFYLSKLCAIELICQKHGNEHPLFFKVMEILYGTVEEFVGPEVGTNNDGNGE
ncbi:EB1, C-terminal [Cinara cedri]|uniref:EB1, C-terminal n=1 Tax=Cinara cedri TaxID=506608 RepID=A0A5E4MHJ3_9HEMI|nr:EB1, C-terminal [Cinara cedri]